MKYNVLHEIHVYETNITFPSRKLTFVNFNRAHFLKVLRQDDIVFVFIRWQDKCSLRPQLMSFTIAEPFIWRWHGTSGE